MNTAGTVLDNLEVRGRVIVNAPNVTIKNSIVTGRSDGSGRGALISNYGGQANLHVIDTVVHEKRPSATNTAGVAGSHFTLTRVTVIGQIDSVNITGSNVLIEDSTLKDTVKWDHDVNQGGGPSHSDNIQVLFGDNITIRGNRITGSPNFAVLGAPEKGSMMNLVVENNYVDNGLCTMKFSSKGGYQHSARVTDNTFGRHPSQPNCDLVVENHANVSLSGNKDSSGNPIKVTYYNP